MAATESGTPSPRGALSKLRRNKGLASASTNSLVSGDGDDSSENGSGIRASIDAAVDKVRERTRRPSDAGRRGSGDAAKRLSNLIPRRKRGSKQEDLGLDRELGGVDGEHGNGSLPVSGNRSDSSLLSASGRSSLLTDENSDVEGYVYLHLSD